MDYLKEINDFLSICSGKIMNVYYELYKIVEKMNEDEQPAAIKYICENIDSIESDLSFEITKEYYTDEQLKRVSQKFADTDLQGRISSLAEKAAKEKRPPDEFYSLLWNKIKQTYKTKRERALIIYELTNNAFIPYKAVGTGLNMSNEEFRKIFNSIDEELISETKYIIALDYEQKTQRSSLLVDNLLKLNDRSKQVVYMSIIINSVESRIKNDIREMLD